MFACDQCSATFSRADNLKRHSLKCINNSMDKHCCNLCEKKYSRKDYLNQHMRKKHSVLVVKRKRDEECCIVNKKLKSEDISLPVKKRTFLSCKSCGEYFFENKLKYSGHLRSQQHLKTCCKELERQGVFEVQSAFKSKINVYRINVDEETVNISDCLMSLKERVQDLVKMNLSVLGACKFRIELFADYKKYAKNSGSQEYDVELKSFNTKYVIISEANNFDVVYEDLCEKIRIKSEEFQVNICV